MYREPHLQQKSDQCRDIWHEWFSLFDNPETKNSEECKNLRKKWSKCCNEFSEMISQEVKTNPRYNRVTKM